MSAMCALVLVTLAALIHGSCGITCYVCRSKSEPACNDPFNVNGTGVQKQSCRTNACLKARVRAKGQQIITLLSARRLTQSRSRSRKNIGGGLAPHHLGGNNEQN